MGSWNVFECEERLLEAFRSAVEDLNVETAA